MDNSQQAVALIKFFKQKEHFLAFKAGTSLFRTPHYFRRLEDIGRGDSSESCLGYWDKELSDSIPNIVRDGQPIDLDEVQSILVYPAHEPKDAWLQSWCMIGPHNNFGQSLERMLDEFGAYFVVLPARNINAYANLISESCNEPVRYGVIRYSDNPLARSLTVKDHGFSYQKEFRFYIGECDKNEVQDRHIRLHGVNNLLLEAGSLRLESASGSVMYCTQGQTKVVYT